MTATSGGYHHHGLLYQAVEDLLATAVPFLWTGLDQGHAVVLACRDAVNAAVLDVLPADAVVLVLNRGEIYNRAATAIASYQRMMRRHVAAGASQVRLLGEVDYGGNRRLWAEWARFESLCNITLAAFPLWSVCAYDSARLPYVVRENVARTHPLWLTPEGSSINDSYVRPREFLGEAVDAHPMESTRPVSEMLLSHPGSLSRLRERFSAALLARAVPAATAADFVAAISEVAANGLTHGIPPVSARLWTDADTLLCTVTDRGQGIDDPLTGYTSDVTGWHQSGRGLWLVRQTCDAMTTSHTSHGFTVRLLTVLARDLAHHPEKDPGFRS